MKTLYEQLGVSRTASQDEIRSRCIGLASKFKTERDNGDLQAAIKYDAVAKIFAVLGNGEKRAAYDKSFDTMSGEKAGVPPKSITPSPSGNTKSPLNATLAVPDAAGDSQAHGRATQPVDAPVSGDAVAARGRSRAAKVAFAVLAIAVVAGGSLFAIRGRVTNEAPVVAKAASPESPKVTYYIGEALHNEVQASTRKFLTTLVTAEMKDPDSAQFRNVTLYKHMFTYRKDVLTPGGSFSLCGEVNAKNAFGGYVGYKDFVAVVNRDALGAKIDEGTIFVSFGDSKNEFSRAHHEKLVADKCKNEVIITGPRVANTSAPSANVTVPPVPLQATPAPSDPNTKFTPAGNESQKDGRATSALTIDKFDRSGFLEKYTLRRKVKSSLEGGDPSFKYEIVELGSAHVHPMVVELSTNPDDIVRVSIRWRAGSSEGLTKREAEFLRNVVGATFPNIKADTVLDLARRAPSATRHFSDSIPSKQAKGFAIFSGTVGNDRVVGIEVPTDTRELWSAPAAPSAAAPKAIAAQSAAAKNTGNILDSCFRAGQTLATVGGAYISAAAEVGLRCSMYSQGMMLDPEPCNYQCELGFRNVAR